MRARLQPIRLEDRTARGNRLGNYGRYGADHHELLPLRLDEQTLQAIADGASMATLLVDRVYSLPGIECQACGWELADEMIEGVLILPANKPPTRCPRCGSFQVSRKADVPEAMDEQFQFYCRLAPTDVAIDE
jgi:predicted Zn-ribbon and HTH transcriptional regulator